MRAKIKNCLNQNRGVFVCWVNFGDDTKKIKRIIYVMRRHHYMKDFNMPTCSMRAMIKHDKEYAQLMGYFVNKYFSLLKKAGYQQERGDGVGFCCSSDNRPFLMYSVGGLKYK